MNKVRGEVALKSNKETLTVFKITDIMNVITHWEE